METTLAGRGSPETWTSIPVAAAELEITPDFIEALVAGGLLASRRVSNPRSGQPTLFVNLTQLTASLRVPSSDL